MGVIKCHREEKPFLTSQIIVTRVFSLQTLACHWTDYQTGNECCPRCPAGSRVKTDCTEFRSTSCLRCEDGTFMDKPNGLKQCQQCADCDSGSGLKVKVQCQPESDTVCEPVEGFFCIDSGSRGCAAAQRHRSCEPGQYIQEQAISLLHDDMAEQKALDMILAEGGGVCSLFGETCCIFIPNNTAPDGTVTKALEGLRSLREELAENSGIDDSMWGWLDNMFASVAALGLCGCCIIPCLRGLMMHAIERGASHQILLQDDKVLTQLLGDVDEDLEDDMNGEDLTLIQGPNEPVEEFLHRAEDVFNHNSGLERPADLGDAPGQWEKFLCSATLDVLRPDLAAQAKYAHGVLIDRERKTTAKKDSELHKATLTLFSGYVPPYAALECLKLKITARWFLLLKKTYYVLFKMTLSRKHLTAATVLIIVTRVFSVQTLTCHWTEYQTGNECCPRCRPGSRVKTDCTEFIITSCLRCEDGTFMDKPNGHKQCQQCADCDSGSGLKVKVRCQPESDTVCEPVEGFFCIDSGSRGCAAAQKHRSCEPGQYIQEQGTASSDTRCSDCSSGTFSNGTLTSCQPHTRCESNNLVLIKAGTSSTDAECGEQESRTAVVAAATTVAFLLLIGCNNAE
ncbi:uncharacterized protein FYW49_004699 [Xenentodon cancila]